MEWKITLTLFIIHLIVTGCFELLPIKSKSRLMVKMIRKEARAKQKAEDSELARHNWDMGTKERDTGSWWAGYNAGQRDATQEVLYMMGYRERK